MCQRSAQPSHYFSADGLQALAAATDVASEAEEAHAALQSAFASSSSILAPIFQVPA